MLDYKSIIIKRYALGLSYKELAEEFSASKSGINDFIRAFERCEKLSYPLPEGITNYAIYELVILSRLVDTFFSRISLTMQPPPKPHNTACVLPWEEGLHWQSRSSDCSSS